MSQFYNWLENKIRKPPNQLIKFHRASPRLTIPDKHKENMFYWFKNSQFKHSFSQLCSLAIALLELFQRSLIFCHRMPPGLIEVIFPANETAILLPNGLLTRSQFPDHICCIGLIGRVRVFFSFFGVNTSFGHFLSRLSAWQSVRFRFCCRFDVCCMNGAWTLSYSVEEIGHESQGPLLQSIIVWWRIFFDCFKVIFGSKFESGRRLQDMKK